MAYKVVEVIVNPEIIAFAIIYIISNCTHNVIITT